MTPNIKHRIEQIRREEVPEGYKKTKHGVLPNEWTVLRVGECLQRVEMPVKIQPNQLYTQIGIRSHGKGLFYKDPVTGTALGNKSVFWIEPDCFIVNIVFAWEQAIGKTTQAEVGMIGSHRFPMYRPVNDRVDVDYLISYFLTKRGTDILEAASPGGAGRNKTLGQDRFLKSKIVLPPIGEQRKIAAILTTQDKVIELKEKRLAEKQRQKKYLMQQLLTGKKRLPGFSKEWKSVRLRNTLNVCHGQNQHNVEQENGVYPILGTGGEIGRTNDFLYDKPSILIGRKGSINKPMYMETPFWTIDTLFYCKIKSGYHPKFLFFKFQSINWNKYDESSGVPSLNASTIGSVDIFAPEFPEQTAIAEVLSAADHEIDLLQQDIEQEKQKKKALMQLLLTGIVRVKT